MMGAEMLLGRQWLLHDPQSNPLASQQHPDSRSCNSCHGRSTEQVLPADRRRCWLCFVETAAPIRRQCRTKKSTG